MTPLTEFLEPSLIHRLSQLHLIARSVTDGTASGGRRSLRHGASIEFGQHRAFCEGDEPRRIDWRVLARTGKLFIREDQQESVARVMLALDCSGSMKYGRQFGTKLRYAQRVLAALAYLLLFRREAVGLGMLSHSSDRWLAPSTASNQLALILDSLSRQSDAKKNDANRPIGMLADRLSRRSLIIIASDCFEPIESLNSALARLRHAKHEVMLLRVLDPDEKNFPFRSAVQFVDLEGQGLGVRNATLLRSSYLRRFSTHAEQLRRSCDQHQVRLKQLQTDRPIDEAIVNLLSDRLQA